MGSNPAVPPGSWTGTQLRPPSREMTVVTLLFPMALDATGAAAIRTFGLVELAAIQGSPYSPGTTRVLGPIDKWGAGPWADARAQVAHSPLRASMNRMRCSISGGAWSSIARVEMPP